MSCGFHYENTSIQKFHRVVILYVLICHNAETLKESSSQQIHIYRRVSPAYLLKTTPHQPAQITTANAVS